MQKMEMWNSTEPTGAALTTSTVFTAAGSEQNPNSKDTKRNRILQKWVKHTLSTWGTRRTYPKGHNSPDSKRKEASCLWTS